MSLLHLSSLLEKSGQPEADTPCKSMSGFVPDAVEKVLTFITVGSVFMVFGLLQGNGILLAKKGRESLAAHWPVW